jgi:hypothetical protein
MSDNCQHWFVQFSASAGRITAWNFGKGRSKKLKNSAIGQNSVNNEQETKKIFVESHEMRKDG